MSTTLKPFPNGLQACVQASLFVGAVSRSRGLRALLFPPILGMSLYMILFTTTGKDSDDIVTWSLIITALLQGSDVLLINDVADLRLVGQKTPTNDLSLFQRCKWASRLLTSPRAIGWVHEPRHVFPPHPPASQSRWNFVKKQSLSALTYFVILDVVHTWIVLSPAFQRDGISLASDGYPMRFLNTALHAAHLWSYMSFGYTAASVVAVALHITEPSEWPALYGRWSDAYTLRRFWGRTWHQVFRRVVSTHGDFVTYRLLKLRKGTFVADNLHRYTAFLVSGIIHAVGEYGMFRDEFREKSGAIRFFLLQATAICVEQEIAKIFKPKPTPLLRWLGYMWTFLWFVHTLPPWMDPQFRRGMADNYGFPFSVTYHLLRGKWELVA
ncbi:hypothetical protein EW146_g4633 [Bondarzewia mesenterica]|uniref:Wax synthase domain-containing protein n=1 Tax=Bondarzewia mesenterica TaxID=1095465 RepID=A0A4V3XF34_9AGAM|nr:hypothetical protein EW146_g4633 [Bondarzewia mesenterica]